MAKTVHRKVHVRSPSPRVKIISTVRRAPKNVCEVVATVGRILGTVALGFLGIVVLTDAVKIWRQSHNQQENAADWTDFADDSIELSRASVLSSARSTSALPIVLLPPDETLVLWDIVCLQLLLIPPSWLRAFGCSIVPNAVDLARPFVSASASTSVASIGSIADSAETEQGLPKLASCSETTHHHPHQYPHQTLSLQSEYQSRMSSSFNTKANMPTAHKIPINTAATATSNRTPTNTVQIDFDIATPIASILLLSAQNDDKCVFCGIARNPDEAARLVYEDDKYIGFHDINPASRIHVLIVPKTHIVSVLNLTERDLPMLREMKALGHNILSKKFGVPVNDHHLGFHVPPFTSVPHLHLHCIAPPFKNWVRSAKYPQMKGWWMRDGGEYANAFFGKGRWIRWWVKMSDLIETLEKAEERRDSRTFGWDFFTF
ncbi:hypothetical protein HK100_007585 [Physocladia obscura]|uniref:HIT domain-containing protein n=1 Tax=Physocladia obscura TaxID=109957 RepID=A0AAD5T4T6_9FUNG|nr:hypothetical protein HK100_007585 [Physocladia obscura]